MLTLPMHSLKTIHVDSDRSDFSKGSIYAHILQLAIPMTIAQLVQMLYSVVDRIYIGHLEGASAIALTGLGLTFPIISLTAAFTNLFSAGGAPLSAISRGAGNKEEADRIMGNTFSMLLISSLLLMAIFYSLMRPLLFLFGASEATYPYARSYLSIYLIGTPFVMAGTGMNAFINAEGFGKTGMFTILLGAVTNIILDPIFIFAFGMGIAGAAIASVISQMLSAAFVISFLTGRRTIMRLRPGIMRLDAGIVRKIMGLGLAGFIMQASNGAVQVACTSTLRLFGSDIYVGIMTVLNSIRDVIALPAQGLTDAAKPVIGYNYGAREYGRIRKAIRFITAISVAYMVISWLMLLLFPHGFIQIFSSDEELLSKGVGALHLYFFGFFMMALQFCGQTVFVGLGKSRQAIFFSLFRKIVIVVPLTLLLPRIGFGINGVFIAEPISNFIGGTACFVTMLIYSSNLFRKEEAAAR